MRQFCNPKGYTKIPYIKGVSERIKRILSGVNIQTAFKPMLMLVKVFCSKILEKGITNYLSSFSLSLSIPAMIMPL